MTTTAPGDLSRRRVLGIGTAAAVGGVFASVSGAGPMWGGDVAGGQAAASVGGSAITPFAMDVHRVSPSTSFATNAWPQGKTCVSSTGRIYQGYNRSSGHGATDTKPLITHTDDLGTSWSTPVVLVPGETNARGTDCFALGIDADDTLWAIVRSRGATNAVGVSKHTLYSSTDAGSTWTARLVLSGVQQGGFVPELFHDMEYVDGRMYSGYHFAASSRLGFLSFNPADPAGSVTTFDVVGHADAAYPPVTYCEPTITWDQAAGKIIGGLRTQKATGAPTQFYSMNPDGSGFARWNAPETFVYSPLPVKVVGDTVAALVIERYGACTMALWVGSRAQFHAKNTASPGFRSVKLGALGGAPIAGSTEMGVQDLAVVGSKLVLSWSFEMDDGSSKVFLGVIDFGSPERSLAYSGLALL